MKHLAVAAIGVVVFGAGHTGAVTTTIDVSENSARLSTSHNDGFTTVYGDVTIPSFDLAPGDTLEVNIALSPTIPLSGPVVGVDLNPIVTWMPGEMVATSLAPLGSALDLTGVELKFSNPDSGSTATLGGSFLVYFEPAPEPATWTLMLTGCGLLGARLRQRRSVAA